MQIVYEVKTLDKWVVTQVTRETPARVYFWDDVDNEEFYLSKSTEGDQWRKVRLIGIAEGYFQTQCPKCKWYDAKGLILKMPRDVTVGTVTVGYCLEVNDKEPIPLKGEARGKCPGYVFSSKPWA